ncbi:DUF4214 domain-containing protein [Trichothermofontia sp.]
MTLRLQQGLGLGGTAAVVTIAVCLMSSQPAAAQNSTVCQSIDLQRARCSINTRNGIELVEELSERSCRNRWQYSRNRNYVEVWDGCRALFRAKRSSGNNWGNNNNRVDYYDDLNRIYRDVLGRDIDRRGYRAYSEQLARGKMTLSEVRREVASSEEARQAINQIYREVLGRDADAQGLRTYQRRLMDGWTLRQVRRALENSDEAKNRRRR